jgi:aspartyl/asparaginyl-tRNA synthetase
MSIPRIKPEHYAYVVKKIRQYCDSQGLTECYLNDAPSTLSACEDPTNLHTYMWNGVKYALPQTSQMWLEHVLLSNPTSKGYYNICNSFRLEQNPVPNRHFDQFPLFEIEGPWSMEEMIQFQKGLLLELGIKPNDSGEFPEIDYECACEIFNVDEIGHDEEMALCQFFQSPVVFLKHFPLRTSPFWNMKRQNDIALKVDVIIGNIQPMEVIGSSERSCNPDEMREMFKTISDGQYAQYLYDAFGQERIDKELDDYLSFHFFKRSGMGIGLNRLIYACQTLGVFDKM